MVHEENAYHLNRLQIDLDLSCLLGLRQRRLVVGLLMLIFLVRRQIRGTPQWWVFL